MLSGGIFQRNFLVLCVKIAVVSLPFEKMNSRRVTTVRQLELLVNFMTTHKQLALGRLSGKEYSATAERLWLQVTDILNSEGPSRTWKEWSKVWSEAKSKVKKKLVDEHAGISGTGGGPNIGITLTPVQEAIADIIGRDVGPIPGAQILGQVPVSRSVSTASVLNDINSAQQDRQNDRDNEDNIITVASESDYTDHEYAVPHADIDVEIESTTTSSQLWSQPTTSSQLWSQPTTSSQLWSQPTTSTTTSSQPITLTTTSSQPTTSTTTSSQPTTSTTTSSSQAANVPATPGSRNESPLVIRRRRAPPTIRARRNTGNNEGNPRRNAGNHEGNSSALTNVQEILSRVELLRAETGRKLAEVAELQANAAATYAEAALRNASAWERNAEALFAIAEALSKISR